jgi:hypothetical protein
MLTVHPKAEFEAWMKSNIPENPAAPAPNPVPEATPADPPPPAAHAHT